MALDLLAHTRTESARFAAVLRDVDPATPAPNNPGWDAADLLWHLAEVHWFWATIVRGRLTDEAQVEAADADKPARPDSYAELVAFYDRSTDELIDALSAADDDVAVWTWAPEQDVGFVRRFQAHEALMHRVDAELIAGDVTPLPSDLAADGIAVVLRYSKSWRPSWSTFTSSGGPGLLHCTDTDTRVLVATGTWSGSSPDTGTTYDTEPCLQIVDDVEPTFTVSAPAADLDAWLWNRAGFEPVTVSGRDADFQRLQGLVDAGVQ
ncbi:MAG: maleylpyruvate isomerase family mycothiol-dependent enzyme [Jatrophihabitans sp.]